MYTLGVNNKGACLVENGLLIAAVAEESFGSATTHYPHTAVRWCLSQAQGRVTHVAMAAEKEIPHDDFKAMRIHQINPRVARFTTVYMVSPSQYAGIITPEGMGIAEGPAFEALGPLSLEKLKNRRVNSVAVCDLSRNTLDEVRKNFGKLYVSPFGSTESCIGAALLVDSRESGSYRRKQLNTTLLGPAYSAWEIEDFLKRHAIAYRKAVDPISETTELLSSGASLGWFTGRLDYGRIATNRLCLSKRRDDFSQIVVLEEDSTYLFGNGPAPYGGKFVDNKELITISQENNEALHALLMQYRSLTGKSSLMVQPLGNPPAMCQQSAASFFSHSDLDYLVLQDFIVSRL